MQTWGGLRGWFERKFQRLGLRVQDSRVSLRRVLKPGVVKDQLRGQGSEGVEDGNSMVG